MERFFKNIFPEKRKENWSIIQTHQYLAFKVSNFGTQFQIINFFQRIISGRRNNNFFIIIICIKIKWNQIIPPQTQLLK